MARPTKPRTVSDDLADLPKGLAESLQRSRDFAALKPERFFHYVYRYEGDSAASNKVSVGRIEGDMATFDIPDDYDLGTRFKKAGLYEIITKIIFRDADGRRGEKSESHPLIRIGAEYEKVDAPAAAPAAVPAAAPTVDFTSILGAFDKLTDMVVKLSGAAPAVVPPDVLALQAAHTAALKASDERLERLRDEMLDREKRLRKDADVGAAPAAEITPDSVEKWAGTAGKVIQTGKAIFDALKPAADAGGANA